MKNDLSLYLAVRDQIRTADLFQWHSNSLLGFAIRWKTQKDRPHYEVEHDINVNHSSLASCLIEQESQELRRYTTEALEKGIIPNFLSVRLENFNGSVWWYPLKDELNDQRAEMAKREFASRGIPYDYRAIVKLMVGIQPKIDNRNLYCNEACCVAWGIKADTARNPNWLPNLGIFKEPVKIL